MTLTRILAAEEEPVSLAELKAHLKISWDAEDADLLGKLGAATRYVEETELGGRALVTSTWEMALPSWPCKPYIDVPLGNLQSVLSMKFTAAGAVSATTVDPADYRPVRLYDPATAGDSDLGFGRIWLPVGKSWPSAMLESGEPIAIRFVCGWKDAVSVPGDLHAAILLCASDFYRNREALSKETAVTLERLCSRFRDRRF